MTFSRHPIAFAALGSAVVAAAAGATAAHAQVQAQGFEDLDRLEARLTAALDADIGVPGGPVRAIDRRLRLARCPVPATIEPPAMGAATLRCEARGWRIRVPLVRGAATVTAASAATTKAAPVIRRGDRVEVVVQGAGFSVTAALTAEQDGAPGDRIRLRGDRANAPVMAEVTQDGRAVLF